MRGKKAGRAWHEAPFHEILVAMKHWTQIMEEIAEVVWIRQWRKEAW